MKTNAAKTSFRKLALLVLLLGACSNRQLLEFDVEPVFSGKRYDGRLWKSSPSDFQIAPRHASAKTPFPSIRYVSKDFEWLIFEGSYGIGANLLNSTAHPLCLDFHAATTRSNFAQMARPIRIYGLVHRRGPANVVVDLPPKEINGKYAAIVPPKVCIEPSKSEYFEVAIDQSELFPSGLIFNTQDPTLVRSQPNAGTGNWLELTVPILINEKPEELTIRLTAKASAIRPMFPLF